MIAPSAVSVAIVGAVSDLAWLSLGRLPLTRRERAFLVLPTAVALWCLGLHGISLGLGDFRRGLHASVAASLCIWAVVRVGLCLRSSWRSPGAPRVPGRVLLAAAIGAGATVAPISLLYNFHDYFNYPGHCSTIAQLVNGTYPPVNLPFPRYPLRYHYGFDTLAASVSVGAGITPAAAIKLSSVALFAVNVQLLWGLGLRLLGRRGWIFPLCLLFGGGAHYLFSADGLPWSHTLLGVGIADGQRINPSTLSYYFQHPWALGLCFSGLLLYGASLRSRPVPGWAWWPAAVWAAALSYSQVILFVTVVPTVLAVLGWAVYRRRGGLSLTVFVALGALAAPWLGGFFGPPTDGSSLEVVWARGVTDSAFGTVVWNVRALGPALLLGLLGWGMAPRWRFLFLLLGLGSFFVLNRFEYDRSWDVVKFGVVCSLALAGGVAVWVDRSLRSYRPSVRMLGGAGLAVTIAPGLLFATALLLQLKPFPSFFNQPMPEATADDRSVIEWLRARVQPGELVYRRIGRGLAYVQYGGLSLPWLHKTLPIFGFSEATLERRRRVFHVPVPDLSAMYGEGVRWLVVEDRETALLGRLEAPPDDLRLRLARRAGPLSVYRLDGADVADGGAPH